MDTWAVLAVSSAKLTAGISFTASPALGSGSLGWFALGVLLAAAYFIRPNAPWHGLSDLGRSARVTGAIRLGACRDLIARLRPRHGHQVNDQLDELTRRLLTTDMPGDQTARSFLAAPTEQPRAGESAQEPASGTSVLADWGRPAGASTAGASSAGASSAGASTAGFRPAGGQSGGGQSDWGPPDRSRSQKNVSRPGRSEWAAANGQHAASGRPSRPGRRSADSRPYRHVTAAEPSGIAPPAPPGPGPAGQPSIRRRSGIRRRIDGMLIEMLRDESDEIPPTPPTRPDEAFWGPTARSDDQPVPGAYRSKHRLNDPGNEPSLPDRPDRPRKAPKHAAPPASFAARLTTRYASS